MRLRRPSGLCSGCFGRGASCCQTALSAQGYSSCRARVYYDLRHWLLIYKEDVLREEEINRLKLKVGELTMDLDILREAAKQRPTTPGTSDE